MASSARFGSFSLPHFGAISRRPDRTFLVLCFGVDIFCGILARLGQICAIVARLAARIFDAGYDLDFMKIYFYRFGFGFKFG